MNDTELAELFETFDDKLTRSISVNLKTAEELRMLKSVSVIGELRQQRIIELIFCAVIILFLGSFLYANLESPSLTISAGIITFFVILDISGTVRQLVLISKFDYAQSVTQNQAILVSLQTHTVIYLRLAILQPPFFLAYILIGFKVFFDVEIWIAGNRNWLISNLILGIILIPVSVWLYRKIQIKNLHIKWVKSLIEFSGGKKLSRAMLFLKEIEKFKNG